MERKWVGPRDYWNIYKKDGDVFLVRNSRYPNSWQDTFWTSWEQIEEANKAIGFLEDLDYNKPAGITPGQAIQSLAGTTLPKRTGYTSFIKETQDAINKLSSDIRTKMLEDQCGGFLPDNMLPPCPHTWATYTGFNKIEIYCTKCKEIQK